MATTLTICQLKVTDLRCHEQMSWTCSDGLNLLIGANGSGKTSLLEAVYLMAHGRSYLDPNIQVASLDHALWFHQPFRADEWLLLSMEAERVAGGRGLARGRFYTREGLLVATTMQEGVMRFR